MPLYEGMLYIHTHTCDIVQPFFKLRYCVAKGEDSRNDVLVPDVVDHALVKALFLALFPHCFICEEGAAEGDVVHDQVRTLPKVKHEVDGRDGLDGSPKRMST